MRKEDRPAPCRSRCDMSRREKNVQQAVVKVCGYREFPAQGTLVPLCPCIAQQSLPATVPTCASRRSWCEYHQDDGRQAHELRGMRPFQVHQAGLRRESDLANVVKPDQSDQGSLVVRRQCEAGKCAGCTVPEVVRLTANGTEITSTAAGQRK